MLIVKRVSAIVTAATVASLPVIGSAWADGDPVGVNCPMFETSCDVYTTGHAPGHPSISGQPASGTSRGVGAPTCTMAGKTVPCQRKDGAWYNSSDECYWRQEAHPAPDDPAWNGHKPGDGALYDVYCPNLPGVNRQLQGGTTWSANRPPGFGGGPDLSGVAEQAVTKMRLLGPDIGMAPDPNGLGGTVGVPVWMWNKRSPQTTGPTSASATALGVTVTATATVQKVDWQMGDGHTVTCYGPGTPYSASDGMAQSPDCGYLYTSTSASEPGGKYQIIATTTWAIHWAGGGQQGDLTTTRSSRVRIPVGELQVVGG